RQQCRPSPQGVEEEDAARRPFPRDEAPQALRETLREESPGEGGSRPSRPQARPQKITARGSATDEASGGPRDWRKRPSRSRAPFLIWKGRRRRLRPGSVSTVEIDGKQDAAKGGEAGNGGSRAPS